MEKMISKLALTKKICGEHRYGCDGCPFVMGKYNCKVKEITYELVKTSPCNWDVEYLEKILRDECIK